MKLKFLTFLMLLMTTVLNQISYSAPLSTSTDLTQTTSPAQKLTQKLAHIQNFYAQFTQITTHTSSHNITSTKSTGHLWLKRPTYFKWAIKNEFSSQLILSNGKKLITYDPDLQQVTYQKIPHNINTTPYLILLNSNADTLTKSFNITLITQTNIQDYQLKPLENSNTPIKCVNIFFKKQQLIGLKILTQTSDIIHITFNKIDTKMIPLNIFKFTPPKGVDILK